MHNTSLVKLSKIILILLTIVGFCHRFIFNDRPIFSSTKQGFKSPALEDFLSDWSLRSAVAHDTSYYQTQIDPLFNFSFNTIDPSKLGVSKPNYPHIFGQDALGRDVCAGIARSIHHTIKIGLLAALLSLILGSIIGFMMAYWSDHRLKSNVLQILIVIIGLFISWFYASIDKYYIAIIFGSIALFLAYLAKGSRIYKLSIPIYTIFSTLINIRKSMPGLILLLCFVPFASEHRSLFIIMVLVLVGWTSIAWIVNNESRLIMAQDYYQASQSLGIGFWKSAISHIYPNIKHTLFTLFVFQIINVILLEASLSFLGIGLPPEDVSFGSLLYQAKENLSAWWLAVFPGIILSMILVCLYYLMDANEIKR